MLNGCNMDAASVMPGGLKELSTDDPSLLREKFKPLEAMIQEITNLMLLRGNHAIEPRSQKGKREYRRDDADHGRGNEGR